MRYVDEYRDPAAAQRLVQSIRRTATRRWSIMEVCGGQTHGLLRHGIETALDDRLELLHGPGCPVCVTPAESIDFAQRLAEAPGVTLATFGDMLRVPGSRESLVDVRARGGSIATVYSPLDAVALAEREPQRQVVFFAVGFETTAPATALAVLQAAQRGLTNFSLLVSHVCVQPAMEGILAAPGCRVQAFLAAGHVCTVTGYASYASLVERYGVPIVVTGFEPLDLLEGLLAAVRCLEASTPRLENHYERSVRQCGNAAAQAIVDRVYRVADRPWRGLGVIPGGGLVLHDTWRAFDAQVRFADERLGAPLTSSRQQQGDGANPGTQCNVAAREAAQREVAAHEAATHEVAAHEVAAREVLTQEVAAHEATQREVAQRDAVTRAAAALAVLDPAVCHSAQVLTGRIKPPECPSFGTRCTPERPLGAPMVSSEGACAAYARYRTPAALGGSPSHRATAADLPASGVAR